MTDEVKDFQVLPPLDPTVCQTCNWHHEPSQPHNLQTLHYKYVFYYANGHRWPTWKDAMAHCDEPTRKAWEAKLRELGHWTE